MAINLHLNILPNMQKWNEFILKHITEELLQLSDSSQTKSN